MRTEASPKIYSQDLNTALFDLLHGAGSRLSGAST